MKNFYFNNLSFALLSLLPLGLVAGPFVAEILMNLVSLIFLYDIRKNKNFMIFKDKIFFFFFSFYIFLIFSLINSDIFSESAINVFFYLRFIIFSFAAFSIIKKNQDKLKYLYLTLSLTTLVVVVDGYIQFIFEKNILGFPKYRADRISGFFNTNLILGSFLVRILPLLIGLTLYLKKEIKYFFNLNLLLIFSTIMLIFLTGERSALFLLIIFLVIIALLVSVSIKIKIAGVSFFILATILLAIFNPILIDRYGLQLKNHLFGNSQNGGFLSYYMPMFKTSLKMFKEKPVIGLGPKSYRYLCSNDKYVSYYPQLQVTDNTIIQAALPWTEIRNFEIKEFLINEGDIIDIGDVLFSYYFIGDDKLNFFSSNKEGKILSITKDINVQLVNSDTFAIIKPLRSNKKQYFYKNSCNTHPHSFYFQLLAETGIIGFLFIFSLFLTVSLILLMNLFNFAAKDKNNLYNLQICLLANFFIFLWPLTTSGNFFNNWLNIIAFYPLGFYLFIKTELDNKNDNKNI